MLDITNDDYDVEENYDEEIEDGAYEEAVEQETVQEELK